MPEQRHTAQTSCSRMLQTGFIPTCMWYIVMTFMLGVGTCTLIWSIFNHLSSRRHLHIFIPEILFPSTTSCLPVSHHLFLFLIKLLALCYSHKERSRHSRMCVQTKTHRSFRIQRNNQNSLGCSLGKRETRYNAEPLVFGKRSKAAKEPMSPGWTVAWRRQGDSHHPSPGETLQRSCVVEFAKDQRNIMRRMETH